MKIEINLYDETGERVVGKAIETNCDSLIINGMHIIQGGGVNAEIRQLEADEIPVSAEQYTLQ
jgi:hypothetical protein